MGSIGAARPQFITSYNSEGQELKIPRSTYENRLSQLQETKKNIMDAGGYNPDELRRIDNQIKDLRTALDTGENLNAANKVITTTATTGTDLETNSAVMEMNAAAKDLGLNVTTRQVIDTDLLGSRHYSSVVSGKAKDIAKLFTEMRRRKGL